MTWNAWGKSWGKSWGVAWGPLLEAPYLDLSGKQRLYVRSVLESVYTKTETEQIIATAARNSISVLDAAISMRVNIEPLQVVVAAAKQRKAQERTNKPAYAMTQPQALFACGRTESLSVVSAPQQLVVQTSTEQLHISTGKD